MKILHVTANYSEQGGAERYVLDICAALEREQHEVVILASSEGSTFSVPSRSEFFLPPAYGLHSMLKNSIKKYRRIIRDEQPDVIHVHNTQNHINPLLLLLLAGDVPAVKFVHDVRPFCPTDLKVLPRTDSLCARPMGHKCWNKQGCLPFDPEKPTVTGNLRKFVLVSSELHATRRFDHVIVGSHFMAAELKRNSVDSSKITVLQNYTTLEEPELANLPDLPTIVCLGQFNRIKGMPQLVEALAHIGSSPWHANLVGEGPLLDNCIRRVAELGLGDRVRFTPSVPYSELSSIFREASIVVLPSVIPEAFGLVGIEAMACGRAVVAFDSGGIREWCIDGVTGNVTPRGDVIALANAIRKLISDPPLARKMGIRGRELVDTKFRLSNHYHGLLSVYRAAIESRGNNAETSAKSRSWL